jgi:segregation and condensation protein A
VDAAHTFFKEKTLPKEIEDYRPPVDYGVLLGDADLNKLQTLFKTVMRRQEDKIDPVRSTFGNIEKDEIDMEQKALYIEEYICSHKTFSFRQLLEKQHSKMEMIVTFLVMLELMKLGKVSIVQEAVFDDITITSNVA